MYTYCLEPHPAFELPLPQTTILRYQTPPKLLSLAETKRLFFCRASKFKDRFEGAWSKHMVARMRERYIKWALEMPSRISKKSVTGSAKTWGSVCWHMSAYESAAMWSLYGLNAEGVAVKS